MTDLDATLDASAPPDGLAPPRAALWWLLKGGLATGPEWERAHAICQTAEGTPACDRVHALCHRIEGDAANAAFWDRRAGTTRRFSGLREEWDWLASGDDTLG
jgi:hypothetical protein